MRLLVAAFLMLWIGCGRLNIEPLAGDARASSEGNDSGDGPAPDTLPAGWWDGAWGHRIKLTFNNDGPLTLEGFPVLVQLDTTRIDFSLLRDDGRDVRFVDADGVTVLPYEIEQWNSNLSYLWVWVPAIDASSNTDHIWLYYGNPTAGTGADAPALWSPHALVWHLGEIPGGTAPEIDDSTVNSNLGTLQGAMGPGQQNSGQLAGSLSFDGTDDWITAPTSASLRITGDLTIQMWVNIAAQRAQWLCDFVFPVSEQEINNHLYELAIDSNDRLELHWEYGAGSDENINSTVPLTTGVGVWFLVTMTRDKGLKEVRFYENGLLLGAPVTYTNDATGGSASSFFLAGEDDNTSSKLALAGRLDEVRIRNDVRTSDWIRADYLSMTGAMVTFGAPESL